jgi:tetratricopeptide (TPR) repeat protein
MRRILLVGGCLAALLVSRGSRAGEEPRWPPFDPAGTYSLERYRGLPWPMPDLDIPVTGGIPRAVLEVVAKGDLGGYGNPPGRTIVGAERRLFLKGLDLVRDGDPEGADRLFQELGQRFPDSPFLPDGLHLRGAWHLAQGRWREGKALLEGAAAGPPTPLRIHLLLDLALLALEEDRPGDAIAWLGRRPEAGQVPPEAEGKALLLAAEIQRRRGKAEEAASLYQSLASFPAPPAPAEHLAVLLGETRFQAGAYASAALLFRRLLEKNPEGPWRGMARHRLAWSLHLSGKSAEAAVEFQRLAAATTDPQLAGRGILWEAWAWQGGGREDLALEAFRRLRAGNAGTALRDEAVIGTLVTLLRREGCDPARQEILAAAMGGDGGASRPLALYLAATFLQRCGRLPEAAAHFLESSRLAEERQLATQAMARGGWLLLTLGRDQEALVTLRRVLLAEEGGSDLGREAAYWLSVLYQRMGNHSQTLFMLDRLGEVTEAARDEQVLILRQRSSYALGRWSQAADASRALEERYPGSPALGEARVRRGLALVELGQAEPALEVLRPLLEQPGPPSGDLLRGIARAQSLLGRHAEAVVLLERILERNPAQPEALLHLGEARGRAGDSAGSAEAYSRFLESYGGDARAVDALRGRGEARFRLGSLAEAAADYEAAWARETERDGRRAEDTAVQLARCLLGLGSQERAEAWVEIFLRGFPGSPRTPELLLGRGRMRAASGRGDLALEDLARLLGAHLERGLGEDAVRAVAGLTGDRRFETEVIAMLRRASAVPQEPTVRQGILLEVGKRLHSLEGCAVALPWFSEALAAAAEGTWRPPALLRSASCARDQGDRAGARDLLRRFVEEFPEHEQAVWAEMDLGNLEAEDGNHQAALTWFGRAALNGSQEPAVRSQRRVAEIFLALGEVERAILEYLKIPILFPDHPQWGREAKLAAAGLYRRAGLTDDARELYLDLATDPEAGDPGEEAREALGELLGPPRR